MSSGQGVTVEQILRDIKTTYVDNYATAQATVAARWAAQDAADGETITLEDFAIRQIVADPALISTLATFPALTIGIGDIAQSDPGDLGWTQQKEDWFVATVDLVYFLRGLSQEILGLILTRNIEATFELFRVSPNLGLSQDAKIIPGLSIVPSADIMQSGGNTMVKGIRVRFQVRFMQYAI